MKGVGYALVGIPQKSIHRGDSASALKVPKTGIPPSQCGFPGWRATPAPEPVLPNRAQAPGSRDRHSRLRALRRTAASHRPDHRHPPGPQHPAAISGWPARLPRSPLHVHRHRWHTSSACYGCSRTEAAADSCVIGAVSRESSTCSPRAAPDEAPGPCPEFRSNLSELH